MMLKLKGFLYGKLLKQLFIISLISCSILLVNSFASAGYTRELGNYGFNPYSQSYDVKISITGTPYTELGGLEKKMFVLYSYDFGYAGLYNNYFWRWGVKGLPYIFMHDGGIGIDSQGYINKYSMCDEILEYSNESKPGNCNEIFVNDNTPNVFRVFLSSLRSSDYYFADFFRENPVMSMTFCISNHFVGNSLCFDSSSLTGSLNIDYGYGFNDISDLFLNDSPAVINNNSGGSSSGSNNTGILNNNQNVYNSLYSQGYRKQLCFGGFGLNDLFGTGSSSFSGIVAGSGATVFQLYNLYSGGQDFIDWYDNNYLDYIYLKEFKDSYEYDKYIGKSKGLVGLGIVRDSFFRGDSFNTANYRYFCNLVLNFSGSLNLNDDSPIYIIDNSLSEDLIHKIVGDIDVLIPTSGSALDFTVKSLCDDGLLTGYLCTGFTGEKDIFGTLEDSWKSWSLSGIKEGVNGILPTYIIVGFFGILILFYLRR